MTNWKCNPGFRFGRVFCLVIGSLVLALGGCAIQICEQEVQVKYDAAADALDLLLIYKGVSASDDKPKTLSNAAEIGQRILGGRRQFQVAGWAFDWDLDKQAEDLDRSLHEDANKPEFDPEENRDEALLLRQITLQEVGVFLDEKERLSAFQHLRFWNFTQVLALLNRQLSRNALREEGGCGSPLQAPEQLLLGKQRAASGLPWVRRVGDEFELDFPLTTESFLQVQKDLVEEAISDDGAACLQYMVYLRELRFDNQRLVARFSAPEGIFRFRFQHTEDYSPQLRDLLVAQGVRIDRGITVEEVRGKLGLKALEKR